MVVAMSILILSSSRGKPIMENRAFMEYICTILENLILAKLAFARFYEAYSKPLDPWLW